MRTVQERYIPVSDPQIEILAAYKAAETALRSQGPHIRQATTVIGALSQQPTDEVWLAAAADFATSEDGPATTVLDVLPLIQRAADSFEPKQVDASRPRAERWTKNWKAVSDALEARLEAVPQLKERLQGWFMTTGRMMVETSYPERTVKSPFVLTIGGANDQCSYRNVLTLAVLAAPKFRAENGMNTRPDATLDGEDFRRKGWLTDQTFIAKLRDHVAEQCQTQEITPRVLVAGSGSRVLKAAEQDKVRKYIDPGAELLYPDRGLTEADAMLAGAQWVFGRLTDSPLIIQEFPASDAGEQPTKLITFESAVGPITVIATTGSEARFRSQLQKAHLLRPDLFQGAEAMYATTTAQYTWVEQPGLEEAAALFGLSETDVQIFGFSAHAAGIKRELASLVGELTNYLKAVYGLAGRAVEASEHAMRYDAAQTPRTLGDLVLQTTVRDPWQKLKGQWSKVWRHVLNSDH